MKIKKIKIKIKIKNLKFRRQAWFLKDAKPRKIKQKAQIPKQTFYFSLSNKNCAVSGCEC